MQDLGDHKKHPLDLRLKNTLSFPQASHLNKATLPSVAGLPSLPPPLSAPSSYGVTLVLEAPDCEWSGPGRAAPGFGEPGQSNCRAFHFTQSTWNIGLTQVASQGVLGAAPQGGRDEVAPAGEG